MHNNLSEIHNWLLACVNISGDEFLTSFSAELPKQIRF